MNCVSNTDAIGITTLTQKFSSVILVSLYIYIIYIYTIYHNTIAHVDLVRARTPKKSSFNHHPLMGDLIPQPTGSPVLCSNMTFATRVRRVLSWGQTALEIGPGVWLFECRLNPLGVDIVYRIYIYIYMW